MEERMSVCCINNKSGGGGGKKCGRWNPSSEQVRVLTELFKCGLRTPTTDQIRKISNQLSVYGKIESKNVFYWFQNHKARERHKCRPKTDDQHNNKLSSSIKYFAEVKKVLEPEREIKTLELFPLNSFKELESEKLRLMSNESKENKSLFTYAFEKEKTNHPPLDLRLSFM